MTTFEHGRLFGYEAAKVGRKRRCPYLPQMAEAIRGWLHGYDEFISWTRKSP